MTFSRGILHVEDLSLQKKRRPAKILLNLSYYENRDSKMLHVQKLACLAVYGRGARVLPVASREADEEANSTV